MASALEESFTIISTSPSNISDRQTPSSISNPSPAQRTKQGGKTGATPQTSSQPRNRPKPYKRNEEESTSWGHIESSGSSVRFDPSVNIVGPSLALHLEKDRQELQEGAFEDGVVARRRGKSGMEQGGSEEDLLSRSFELLPSSQEQSVISHDQNDSHDLPCKCLKTRSTVSKQYSIDPEVMTYLEEGRQQGFRQKLSSYFYSEAIIRFITLIMGLWSPGLGFRVMFTVLSLLISLYVVTGFAYTSWICLHYTTPLDVAFCPEKPFVNKTLSAAPVSQLVIYMNQFFELEISIIQVLTYLTLYFSLLRLRKNEYTFTFLEYVSIVRKYDWLALNAQVLVILGLIVAQNFDRKSTCSSGGYPPNHYTYFIMNPAPTVLWLNLASGCWIFAVIACALVRIVESCERNIRDLKSGDIDDVIDIHQHLCGHVTGTVAILKYWFLAHWLLFLLLAISGLALMVVHIESPKSVCFSFVTLILVMYTFLCPCVYAIRVTDKCIDIILILNRSRTRDWPQAHPFHSRTKLNLFLQYAEGAQCSFKTGGVVFGRNFAWLSLIIALCGLAVKMIGG